MMSTKNLRDYFAASAVSGILANANVSSHADMTWVAEKGFEIADQMLKAAKKKVEKPKAEIVAEEHDLDLS